MCGILGAVSPQGIEIPGNLFSRSRQILAHRGPDDYGYLNWREGKAYQGTEWEQAQSIGGVFFLHCRLSILDLSQTGHQPMGTPDGRFFISFNGEIYNYLEIRAELERLGHKFVSTSDTEVLLHAYAQWGIEALSRMSGMFAFSILDTIGKKVILARDYFGIKPLYYCWAGKSFIFASEIKALLEFPGVPRIADSQRVYDYLRFGMTDHGEDTMFGSIRQLLPGQYIEIPIARPSGLQKGTFFKIGIEETADISFDEAAAKLGDLFHESITQHLRSDVEVGAALSGGIDSSSIVMAIRQILGPNRPFKVFCYVAKDSPVCEERWMDLVGKAARAEVCKIVLSPENFVDDLRSLIRVQEEPFTSTSIYAQYKLFSFVQSAGIKVMLDGQGADELLGGYSHYLGAKLASLLHSHQWSAAMHFFRNGSHSPLISKSSLACQSGEYLLPYSLRVLARRVIGKDLTPSWLSEDWCLSRGVHPRSFTHVRGKNTLRTSLLRTIEETSVPHLLRYEDRNSMAFSVESRVPFLTPKLVKFVLSLPESYIIAPDGTTKAVFRRAMRGYVPDAILDRRDKIGFETPEHDWLECLRPWVDRLFFDEGGIDSIPALNPKQIRRQWDVCRNSNGSFDSRFWRWINLVEWRKVFNVAFEV